MTTVIVPRVEDRAEPGMLAVRELTRDSEWALLETLLRTCSPATLARRFFLPRPLDVNEVARRFRRFLFTTPPRGATLLALAADTPVGLLNLVAIADHLVEAGAVVADAWQHQGVGSLLVGTVTRAEHWRGWTVRAAVQPDNLAARGLIRRAAPAARSIGRAPGEHTVEIAITA